MEVKQQLYSELIHKSEERMKEEMQSLLRKTVETAPKTGAPDERVEEMERSLRKLEKTVSLDTGKIFGAY